MCQSVVFGTGVAPSKVKSQKSKGAKHVYKLIWTKQNTELITQYTKTKLTKNFNFTHILSIEKN